MDQRVREPSMPDLAVIAKTGKSWAEWFRILDRAGAIRLDHGSIVKLLAARHDIGPWWRRMVAVEYERSRGLRIRNRAAIGHSISISRTIRTGAGALYEAASELRQRRKWFPKGTLKISGRMENRSLRGSWNGEGRLEITFYERPEGRAQVVVEVNRLAHAQDVERERSDWRRALMRLDAMLCRAAKPYSVHGVKARTSPEGDGVR